jgi:phage I-like protein
VVKISGQDVAIDEQGLAVWNARTVHEVADAVRWLAGQIQAGAGGQAEAIADLQARVAALEQAPPPQPPDLSGYATTAELEALATEVTAVSDDLTALEDRVTALEQPAAP